MLFLVALALLVLNVTGNPLSPDTVDTLDLTKFAGFWYQMYGDFVVMETFERNSFCDTAEYTPLESGNIGVHNAARMFNQTGDAFTIDGKAWVDSPDEPGQLSVFFSKEAGGSGHAAPYWVLDLGPENADGLYDWAIVSDNFSSTLFVLARSYKDFRNKYEDDIMKELEDLGFTGRKKPVAVYQDDDCIYEH